MIKKTNLDWYGGLASIVVALVAVLLSPAVTRAQERPYFVDGYHGGIYGHYPVPTYTKFLVDQFKSHPDWAFCLEIEPETWDTVAVRTPEDYRQFAEIVKIPRVEFTNPAYAQPYMYNISGESIIRQFQYGMRKVWSHFPNVEFVTYAVEEPCFTSCLPQILGQLGFRYASLKCPNTCWGGYTAPFGHGPVNWTGPDGSILLAIPRYACEALEMKTVWQTKAAYNPKEYIDTCLASGVIHPVGMCYQDAGWTYGPWIGYGDNVASNSQYVTWREYFENVASKDEKQDYKMQQEDVRTSLMWGSQVLQRIARQVRSAENCIVKTEKAAAALTLLGASCYDQSLFDEAWRALMLAQHHDSWIVPYNGLNSRGTWADNIALWTASSEENCAKVLDGIVGKEDFGSKSYGIQVFNTLRHSRKAAVTAEIPEGFRDGGLRVRDSRGKDVPFTVDGDRLSFCAELCPFGMTAFKVTKAKKSGAVVAETSEHGADNGLVVVYSPLYEMTFDPSKGGVITSLRTSDGREYVDITGGRAMNELRGWLYDEEKWCSSADSPAKLTVRKTEGLRTEVSVEGMIAGSPFVQTITLSDDSPLIEFTLRIDWKSNPGIGKFRQNDAYANKHRAFYDDRYKLNVLFPMSLDAPELYKDAPFDVCLSTQKDTYFDRWENIKHNVILNWVDLLDKDGRGAALYTDHTTTYTYGPDFPLALTVQYTGNGLWGRDHPITQPTEIRYALMPHTGSWDKAGVQECSAEWNETPMAFTCAAKSAHGKSLIDVEGTGYAISSFNRTDGGYVLRLYNADGDEAERTVRLGFPVKEIIEVNLLGEKTADVSYDGGSFMVKSPRFSVRTYYLKTE